jgi:glucosamine kinase
VSRLLIAVDGGGTLTRVAVADEAGSEFASAEGPGSAVQPDDIAHSAKVISETIQLALRGATTPVSRAALLFVGVAGAGRTHVADALADLLQRAELADEVMVDSDAAIAMHDAFGAGPGILLTAGTGSVAFGRGPAGAFARAGGWGHVCGDEGGAYWLGRRALSAVTAAADGREPETALSGAILTAVEANTPEDLIGWAAAADVAAIASLAQVVLRTAAAGDLRADALVTLAAEELVLHVRTLARQLFGDERAASSVALSGGLLSRGSFLRERVEVRLRSGVPGAVLNQEEVQPLRGAMKLARRAEGREMISDF